MANSVLSEKRSSLVDPDIEAKIDDLMAQMTLEEKVGQMNQYTSTWDVTGPTPDEGDTKDRYEKVAEGKVGSMLNILGARATYEAQKIAVENSRLGIPLIFGYDVIHGYKTMFPIPIADASSWDLEVIKTGCSIAAKEAAAAGVHWTFAPMMDIARDARWGRIMEGAGEDPYLGSRIAEARVKGFQGNNLDDVDTIAATAKHFAGYGFVIAGLDYNTTELNQNTLFNTVLPPFKAAVDAGVATVMNAFNDYNGIPVTGNKFLQKDLLKEEWQFDGFIVSDWNTIGEMPIHQYAKHLEDAALKAANAGTDMDMESRGYEYHLCDLVRSGKIQESVIDDSVRRILRVKFLLGLFDDPYRYCSEEREQTHIFSDEHKAIARDAAKRSVVLLKNDTQILPLSKTISSLAVIGSLAEDKDTPLGSWRGQAEPNSAVSLLEGIQNAVSPSTQVIFEKGYHLASGSREFTQELTFDKIDDTSGFDAAIEAASNAEVVVIALGEECFQSGEGRSQTSISLKGKQLELLKKLHSVNPNVVAVLMNGRPIAEPWLYENIPSVLETWHLGSEAGNAIADVLFGEYNPSGKLPVSIPRNLGQVPIYYNHNQTGRPDGYPNDPDMVFWSHYTDSEKTPQFYFGHGLSYTSFEYSDLCIEKTSMIMSETIEVSVRVKNTGAFPGEEVVQFYINDKYSSTIRPVKELKGFQKIYLEPGEEKTVAFEINWQTLAFYGDDQEFKAEPGEFEIMIGGNSQKLLRTQLQLLDNQG